MRLRIRGELDLTTTRQVRDALQGLERSGYAHLLLDLRGLTFMDCTGLRIMLDADRRARLANRRVDVVVGGQVARLIALGDTERQLQVRAPVGPSARHGLRER